MNCATRQTACLIVAAGSFALRSLPNAKTKCRPVRWCIALRKLEAQSNHQDSLSSRARRRPIGTRHRWRQKWTSIRCRLLSESAIRGLDAEAIGKGWGSITRLRLLYPNHPIHTHFIHGLNQAGDIMADKLGEDLIFHRALQAWRVALWGINRWRWSAKGLADLH